MSANFDGFNDELWDEFKWEAHLNEVERKSEQLRKFIASDRSGNTPRWVTLLKESLDEDDAFEAFVEEELLMDEAYFPEDEEDDWDEDDFEDDDFLFGGSDEFPEFEEEDEIDDFDSGEEWKQLSQDFTFSEYGSLDNLTTYNTAKNLAVDILRWAENVPRKYQNKKFQDFVSESLKIGAKLAGGYSFGFETDYIGANIAYSKKALGYANQALTHLHSLKKKTYFEKDAYLDFHERLFELRNDIGIYVQELRDQFRFGLE